MEFFCLAKTTQINHEEIRRMKTYNVTIKAEIYKTITVSADDENAAYAEAHEIFSVVSDEWPERYNEETISIVETPRP